MSDASTIEGGCRCGAVRYRAEGEPLWVSHCHCEECRRSSGAPVSTFVGVRDTGFAFVAGTPGAYESSPHVVRKFCGACGTPLTYEAAVYPGEVHIMAGTLDEPETLAPERHVLSPRQHAVAADHGRPTPPRHPAARRTPRSAGLEEAAQLST